MNALKQNNELHNSLILQTDISTEEITFPHRLSDIFSLQRVRLPNSSIRSARQFGCFTLQNHEFGNFLWINLISTNKTLKLNG